MVAAFDDGNRRYVAAEIEAFARPYRRRVHVLVGADAMLSPRTHCLRMRMCLVIVRCWSYCRYSSGRAVYVCTFQSILHSDVDMCLPINLLIWTCACAFWFRIRCERDLLRDHWLFGWTIVC